MKKLFILFAAATLFVGAQACKQNAADENAEETTEEVAEEPVEETASADADVPNFDNADVQAYIDAYEEYINAYKEAVESKDMTKFQELATKGQDLATKGQDAMSKLSGDDVQKLTDYMTEKSKEIQDLAMKMSGQ